MKTRFLHLFLILAAGLLFTNCRKSEPPDIEINTEGMIVLGEKLENPYAVANMQQAYSNLKSAKADIPDFNIETTHLYVRFLPENIDELSLLENDTTLQLSEIPFDYEVSQDGYFYHDLSLPANEPTWLYAAIEKSKALPAVKHELLSELFLPPTPDELTKSYNDKWIGFFDLLEHEALKITGNLEGDTDLKTTKGSSWQPKGKITMWDDVENDYVPIEFVEVEARRWFQTIKGITDVNGDYVCGGTFKRAANYSIVWNRYQFSVNTNNLRTTGDPRVYYLAVGSKRTRYKGPKQIGDWNLYLQKGSVSLFHGNIFRAAAQYYYGNISGLQRPPLNINGRPKMRIIASLEVIGTFGNTDPSPINTYAEHDPDAGAAINPSWIEIYYTYINSDELYGIVLRELAYASLFALNEGEFKNRETPMILSWGLGVELFLTRKLYPTYSIHYSRYDYSGIVEDLTDGIKTTSSNFHSYYGEFGYKAYQDSVSGYSISQIEASLNNATTIERWILNLKNSYVNETEDKLDKAFSYWFYY